MEAVEMFPEMRAQPASAGEAIPVLDVGLYLLQSKVTYRLSALDRQRACLPLAGTATRACCVCREGSNVQETCGYRG